jgi:hypothetical protein
MTSDELAARWPLPDHHEERDALVSAYGDPMRGYHDLLHLTEVLDRIDELTGAGIAGDGPAVRLAAWFHDGVYDGKPDAEERSAAWAARALADTAHAEEVARLVRTGTTTHRRRPARAGALRRRPGDPGRAAGTPTPMSRGAARLRLRLRPRLRGRPDGRAARPGEPQPALPHRTPASTGSPRARASLAASWGGSPPERTSYEGRSDDRNVTSNSAVEPNGCPARSSIILHSR